MTVTVIAEERVTARTVDKVKRELSIADILAVEGNLLIAYMRKSGVSFQMDVLTEPQVAIVQPCPSIS